MNIIGIDPGFNGGWAHYQDGELLHYDKNPTMLRGKDKKLENDLRTWWKIFDKLNVDLYCIELVGPVPNSSRIAAYSFGRAFEACLAIPKIFAVRYELVRPQAWKKLILEGTDKSKAAARAWCNRRWPEYQIPKHDGIWEAICLAEYAWRTYAEGSNERVD